MNTTTATRAQSTPVKAPARPGPRSGRLRTAVLAAGFAVLVLAGWDALVRWGPAEIRNANILPLPESVFHALVDLSTSPDLGEHILTTATESIGGFLLGSAVGIFAAVLMQYIPLLATLLTPYIVAFQVMPKVVLAPVFITWLGFGMSPKLVTAAAIVFFPVLVNTRLGLQSADGDALEMMKSLSATRLQTFRKVVVPSALPAVMAGLVSAATLAPIGALVAEFLSSQSGLGYLLLNYMNSLQTDYVFAGIVIISLLGFALYGSIRLLEKRLVYWT